MTATTPEGPALTAAPVNGWVVPVIFGTPMLEPAAPPGIGAAGAPVAAA